MQYLTGQTIQPALAGTCASYVRRRPEELVHYQLVAEHASTFFRQVEAVTGVTLSDIVKSEFETFLECGILTHGCLCLRCDKCHHAKPVLFSCERRRVRRHALSIFRNSLIRQRQADSIWFCSRAEKILGIRAFNTHKFFSIIGVHSALGAESSVFEQCFI